MKTPLTKFRLAIGIISVLVLILAVLLMSAPAQLTPQAAGAGSPDLQSVTPTPTIDPSEVGSTNGIVLLAFAIVGIVVLPVILRWKDWSAKEK